MTTSSLTKRVLVVEDEAEIARLVELHLADQGYRVEVVGSGEEALRRLPRPAAAATSSAGSSSTAASPGRPGAGPAADAPDSTFDLVILDLMLPGCDGLEVCRRLRAAETYTPILMLTARSGEADRVAGLEEGADDYLTKPFSVRELVARVKAIFRRVEALASPGGGAPRVLRIGELTVDPEKRRVTLGDEEVHLTAREFDLLHCFAARPGRVFTRGELLETVWGYAYEGYEHTVNSHINRLRAKIEADPSNPRWVLTVWGVGYRFTEEAA